jgi:hypothetical protein
MAQLKINAQYFENYNYHEGGEPCWKSKGGISFIIEDFDADTLFYDRERVIEVMKELVARENTSLEKFEYISHELTFAEPIVIPNYVFQKFYTRICENS